jgi:hypothetical protein
MIKCTIVPDHHPCHPCCSIFFEHCDEWTVRSLQDTRVFLTVLYTTPTTVVRGRICRVLIIIFFLTISITKDRLFAAKFMFIKLYENDRSLARHINFFREDHCVISFPIILDVHVFNAELCVKLTSERFHALVFFLIASAPIRMNLNRETEKVKMSKGRGRFFVLFY